MKIANLMFATGSGGIEQAFLDYTHALMLEGHEVMPIVHPDAWATAQLEKEGISVAKLRNWGGWDLFAAHRLKQQLAVFGPDIIIAHGNRALCLGARARGATPLAVVTHNYRLQYLNRAHAAICITRDLVRHAQKAGMEPQKIFHVPNMIRLDTVAPHRPREEMLVIGAMGRMVPKKGFDLYLEALKILKDEGIAFRAVLGGDGETSEVLAEQAAALGLSGTVTFPGWVADRGAFFRAIDVFCLPSRHEPFGIVLLEAMAYGVPIVSTQTEGPGEILVSGDTGLLVSATPAALAEGLRAMLTDAQAANAMAAAARREVEASYAVEAVAPRLTEALEKMVASAA